MSILETARRIYRKRRFAPRLEPTYVFWIDVYLRSVSMQAIRQRGVLEVKAFLDACHQNSPISPTSWRRAVQALLFFSGCVLPNVCWPSDSERTPPLDERLALVPPPDGASSDALPTRVEAPLRSTSPASSEVPTALSDTKGASVALHLISERPRGPMDARTVLLAELL